MAFFKNYNGSNNVKLVRIERLVWVLIYGGLLSVVISNFLNEGNAALSGAMIIGGLLVVSAGIVLIYVRSRLHEGNDQAK
ncbi:MAG: hypothetical protein H7293_07795 [Candidatus Saccharibacteria bacterium]|nr:hypothetical protein [Rhodoferax sp.]